MDSLHHFKDRYVKIFLLSVFFTQLICLFPETGWSQLPPTPIIEGLPSLSELPAVSEESKLGAVQISTGGVYIIPASEKGIHTLSQTDVPLGRGDILSTNSQGRCQVVLENHDILQIGQNSIISLGGTPREWTVDIWKGTAVVMAYPELTGFKGEKSVQLPHGVVAIRAGKTGFLASQDPVRANRVLAIRERVEWRGSSGVTRTIAQGQVLTDKNGGVEVGMFSPDAERDVISKSSPESLLVIAGIRAYDEKKYDDAIGTLKTVVKYFRNNGQALYFLGLAHLAQDEVNDTIGYWRRYETIDPQGAKEKEIPQQLTVLISQRIKDEVKEALSRENLLTNAKAEPNSVAVPPFLNKGNEKFGMLAKGITAMIIADLSKVPGIKVLEREKMQKLLDEISLSQSGLVDEKTEVRAGKIMRAEKIVMGDFTVDGSVK